MMRSLYAGISGLQNHQLRMDVIGNNIANVNTVGFKSSRVTFKELFNQTLRGAAAPAGPTRGGTNPIQIGLGTALAGIDVIHQPGNPQVTGVATDLAIQGDGFFVLQDAAGGYAYTRAGDFRLDAAGYLVNADGLRVLGWQAQGGVLPARDAVNLGPIRVPVDMFVPAQASSRVTWSSNLDATTPTNTPLTRAVDVYDSLGNAHTLIFTFTRTGSNQWSWQAEDAANPGTSLGQGTLTFGNSGLLTAGNTGTVSFTPTGAATINLQVDFSGLTQYAAPSTLEGTADGYPAGELTSFAIDTSGTITGTFSNGTTQPIAQVALASFANPAGLLRDGNLYWESNNSGVARIGVAGTGGRGALTPGALEMSNVDLSREFVDMIVTQRGFQANSRVITTSDEMLQELVNLKR
ncbi:flagellar hook-basal body protein [Thermaerobacter marianensis DSM 12885]|uniref:Flagellar hook protein FlgE n=1 Tax=Thermaerobacter marianensis (strain ATCC 700841 / DSM 12885 / JCM 10246 / 7p75a) TaxID=644966 RepID=E6SJN5_THEM7|nr:flagellar hook protein FlgE [Thermaerobacter marianensis]ADU51098.1 flagellar hook-basal body protein [Thermaerobacter marianensis DSM 12885]